MPGPLDISQAISRAEKEHGQPMWTGDRLPADVDAEVVTLVTTIESAQEYVRRALFQFSAGPFQWLSKFQHGQVGAKLADVIGELEKVRMMIAPAKEGRP